MGTIWKVSLDQVGENTVEVPAGAEFLCAREQFNKATVWFRCNPEQPKVKRTLLVYLTGGACSFRMSDRFLGTVFSGPFVYHVFERTSG